MSGRDVLRWGHFDPHYSRNRILAACFAKLGWQVTDYRPRLSRLGHLEARWRVREHPALVWVPCFRQRDIAAAARWCAPRRIPLLVDPLISAYDKQVSERGKLASDGWAARRLLHWERRQLALAQRVLADTEAHADYFHDTLGVPRDRISIVPVGAEDALFRPAPHAHWGEPLEALFYGSFSPLQGPQVIVEAARLYRGPPLHWTLLGHGPLREACRSLAADLPQVRFEEWIPYADLPQRIQRADILLGIFGATPKALRVIPNKVFQSLACAKPLVTLTGPAYPQALRGVPDAGFAWVPPADARALASTVEMLAAHPEALRHLGAQARATYERYFSASVVCGALQAALPAVSHDIADGGSAPH